MQSFWICHWRFAGWHDAANTEFNPVYYAGSNMFSKRGVKVGDTAYVVSLSHGQLYFGGRMTVDHLTDRANAVKATKNRNLFDANEWIIGSRKNGTRLDLHRVLAPSLTKALRFLSPSGEEKEPFFVSGTKLDVQATRGIRQITRDSAKLLDRILTITDRMPRDNRVHTVSASMLDVP